MRREALAFHIIMNAFWDSLDFELPEVAGREPWRRWIDTSLPSPGDITPWQSAPAVSDPRSYPAAARSVVVLWRRIEAEAPENADGPPSAQPRSRG
jgi:glycogen operon protein